MAGARYPSLFARLVANTAEPEWSGGCWVWLGARDRWGYGRLAKRVPGKGPRLHMAHIEMWQQVVGPVPEGLELDHLCENEACINPEHLEPVTHAENCRRRDARRAALACAHV